MSKKLNLIGQKFGKLTVLEECNDRSKYGAIVYKCLCDCGNVSYVTSCNLRAKNGTKSCGCSHVGHSTHGKRHTRLYSIWLNMKQRCYNPKRAQYKDWGGRGIVMCDEWKNDFIAFYDWSMSNGYNDDLTIDRIDNNKNYKPDNCRWVDHKIQSNNKRDNVLLTFNGKTQTMKQWADELGVRYETMRRKRNLGEYFIIACLSRFFSIKKISKTFNVDVDDLLEKYHEERSKYTDAQIEKILKEVYYID